ncbi:MAG: cell division protein FtsA [Thermoflexales bacterium]|nr:cell division protein FtsA [Thermoflexales bacterium]
MAEHRVVTVVDVGSTKILTLVGEAAANDVGFTIIGVGSAPSRGIRRGQVISVADATSAIRESLAGAQASSGVKPTQVVMSINGAHIASQNTTGAAAISRGDQGVTEEDVARCVDAAQAIPVPNNRRILHVIPRHFRVDEQEGVRNPLGMLGFRLEVQAHVVTCAVTAEQNLLKCAHSAGVDVSEFVLAPLGAAEAVLTQTEKDMGVVLVDIGGGVTSMTIFTEGAAWYTKAIEVGGAHFTNDLAQVLRLPFEAAEQFKLDYGHANPADVSQDQICEIAGFGDEPRVRLLRREAAEILQARAEELFDLVEQEIRRSDHPGLLTAGLVLTGGGALLSGLRECARRVTGRPVRTARPKRLFGMADGLLSPSASTAVGLLHWSLQGSTARPAQRRRLLSRFDLSRWLRGLLPE